MISRQNEFIEELAKSLLPQLVYIDESHDKTIVF